MWKEKGKNIRTITAKKAIQKAIANMWDKKLKKEIEETLSVEPWKLDHWAEEFVNLNRAILSGRSVWAECEKEPRSLDSGNHYYSVFYITKDGKKAKFWVQEFSKYLGAKDWTKNWECSRWVYYSGAIGMSRVLDATDHIFTFLKKMGGCYTQL